MASQPSGESDELGWTARVAQRSAALRLLELRYVFGGTAVVVNPLMLFVRDVRNLTRVGV